MSFLALPAAEPRPWTQRSEYVAAPPGSCIVVKGLGAETPRHALRALDAAEQQAWQRQLQGYLENAAVSTCSSCGAIHVARGEDVAVIFPSANDIAQVRSALRRE